LVELKNLPEHTSQGRQKLAVFVKVPIFLLDISLIHSTRIRTKPEQKILQKKRASKWPFNLYSTQLTERPKFGRKNWQITYWLITI